MASKKWVLPLYKREADEVVTTLESASQALMTIMMIGLILILSMA
jgi:hypothetical protein